MKKFLSVLMLMCLTAILLVACGGAKATEPNDVGMDSISFLKEQVTIKKGESVNLVNESSVVHTVANGTWKDGNQLPKAESGAPKVDGQIPGSGSLKIGPFNNAGTFLIYCPLHPGMKLTVVVK